MSISCDRSTTPPCIAAHVVHDLTRLLLQALPDGHDFGRACRFQLQHGPNARLGYLRATVLSLCARVNNRLLFVIYVCVCVCVCVDQQRANNKHDERQLDSNNNNNNNVTVPMTVLV